VCILSRAPCFKIYVERQRQITGSSAEVGYTPVGAVAAVQPSSL